jgi:hypothetical protein
MRRLPLTLRLPPCTHAHRSMLRVCKCSHVHCQWELQVPSGVSMHLPRARSHSHASHSAFLQHTCKVYSHHSWCGFGHDYSNTTTCQPNGINVYHNVSDFESTAFVLGGFAEHNGRYGTGDQHGKRLV